MKQIRGESLVALIRNMLNGQQPFGATTLQYIAPVYVAPQYLIKAAQRKYQRGIFVIGANARELNGFWEKVDIKASGFEDRPKPVARTIVADIIEGAQEY